MVYFLKEDEASKKKISQKLEIKKNSHYKKRLFRSFDLIILQEQLT